MGGWDFAGAADLSCVCLIFGIYFHFVGRRFSSVPDASSLLDQAHHLAAFHRTEEAIAVLSETIRLSPQLWQAYQYRGELYIRENALEPAIHDFTRAIRLAPREPHLYAWRAYARTLLGDQEAARNDYDVADALASASPPEPGAG